VYRFKTVLWPSANRYLPSYPVRSLAKAGGKLFDRHCLFLDFVCYSRRQLELRKVFAEEIFREGDFSFGGFVTNDHQARHDFEADPFTRFHPPVASDKHKTIARLSDAKRIEKTQTLYRLTKPMNFRILIVEPLLVFADLNLVDRYRFYVLHWYSLLQQHLP